MPDTQPFRPLFTKGDGSPLMPADYVELGVTTAFSFLRGASQPDELVLAGQAQGYDAIGVADLNSLAGVVRVHAAARRAGMRAVIGARIVLSDGTGFLAYPADRAAYGRLSALISGGRMRDLAGNWQAKGACDLTVEDLVAASEGLHLVWLPGDDLSVLPRLAACLSGLRYVAACYRYGSDDVARINRLDRAARGAGLSLLATNDVLYHTPDRRPLQDVMTCIRHKVTLDQAGERLSVNAERHLKSPEEMKRLFARWPHAIRATRELADACRFSLQDLRYDYPHEVTPDGLTADEHLWQLTWQGAAWRYPRGIPLSVHKTLRAELAQILEKGIAPYFLTIHDIVRFAVKRGILCQGRGSAANSAVCFVLGITPVDPVKGHLLFERFISKNRNEPPDIDVDFEHERREEVIQHIYQKYGRHRAGLCATVIHYRPRSAIRDVGRAMGLSEDVTGALANTVWGSWGDSMQAASLSEAGLDPRDPGLSRVIRLAEQMIGMPRHLSQHVGGFILSETPLTRIVPIGNGAMADRSFIEWDKDDLDELGILKVDILALGMLTCIRKCFDLVAAHTGHRLTLATVPQEDKATYGMLSKGDSVGVFQVESRAQMNMLPRLRPTTFYDLVIEVAIVRPGPIQGNMVHPYLRRRMGHETPEYPSPRDGDPRELEHILQRTLGVPIFQEQAMKIAMVAAGFDSAETEELRRAMATFRSRGGIEKLEQKMVGRMVARGYQAEFAQRCFDQIKGFGEYGFPESHAAAFAHLVYVSAWLRCHYPAAFAAALLNSQPMGFYAPAQIIRDAQDHGVAVYPPDVNYSDWDNTLVPSGGCGKGQGGATGVALRLGLRQVAGLAKAAGARVLAGRDIPYDDLGDLQRRTGLDMAALGALAAADCCGSMGIDRRGAIWQAQALKPLPPLPLFRQGEPADPQVELPVMPKREEVIADYQTLRLSLKAHPLRFLRRSLQRQGYVSANGLAGQAHGARVQMAGLVLIRQRPGTAKGVCFLTIEDETGTANLVFWPKVFTRFRKVVMGARVIAIKGRIQRAQGITHIVVTEAQDRSDVLGRLAGTEKRDLGAARPTHPRAARIIPASRDFH